jgi:hypothetical protein
MENYKIYDINYFENEHIKITLYKNNFNDKFGFYLDYNDNNIVNEFSNEYLLKTTLNIKIIVKRLDTLCGWGQDLNILLYNKLIQKESIINIGSSDYNIKLIDYDYDIDRENIIDHIYFENDFYKIFYISYKYNDVFNIDYNKDEQNIIVKRLDKNEGWGQDLNLKYVDKDTLKEKIIYIGSSETNEVIVNIRLSQLEYRDCINYYESSYYHFRIIPNIYPDLFIIRFYEENNTIYIKRIDKNSEWGQNLFVEVEDLINNVTFQINIGPSMKSEIYKKIDLTIRKCYVSLTTIPSRIKLPQFKDNIIYLFQNQTYPLEKLFITIPKKYKRFNEDISSDIINDIKEIDHRVCIIEIDVDYGPASKYLGPLMNYYDEIKDNLLIVIDDDRIYNKNLLKNFCIGYHSYPFITFSSGFWKMYFDKEYKTLNEDYIEYEIFKESNNNKFFYGQGLGGFFGFCIKVQNLENFIKYNFIILDRIPKSFYHDEGIILGYLKYNQEKILYLKHYGCNFIENELVDALCKSNLVDRGRVEKDILLLTNLEKII